MSQVYQHHDEAYRGYSTHQRSGSSAERAHDASYYSKCLVGGALSSSIRWVKTPFDAVKCNMQVNPQHFPTFSSGLQRLWVEDGLRGLYRGLGPTVLSYSCQTGTKYGMYELLKDRFLDIVDEESAFTYRSLIYLTAAGCAEGVADVLMCPWEMLKVKMQTSAPGTFPMRTGLALVCMIRHHKDMRFPFGALRPLWARQLPGTMANFLCFEYTVDSIYTNLLTKPKSTYETSTQLAVTFAAGYIAGFVSTVVSHPADSLVSLRAKPKYADMSLSQIFRHVGLCRLMTKGLVPRVAMTGSIIACQWIIYDAFKMVLGIGTTGGSY